MVRGSSHAPFLYTVYRVIYQFSSIHFIFSPRFKRSRISVAMVKKASLLEFRAVSKESCTTPIMKPTATTCIATSLLIPNNEHAIGIRSSEPPATPDAPQAPKVAMMLSSSALPNDGAMPNVWQAAKVITVMVTAAPSILIVLPRGMLTE